MKNKKVGSKCPEKNEEREPQDQSQRNSREQQHTIAHPNPGDERLSQEDLWDLLSSMLETFGELRRSITQLNAGLNFEVDDANEVAEPKGNSEEVYARELEETSA